MAKLKGLASIVSELRAERTNLASQLKHVDAALSVLGKLNGGSSYTKPRHILSAGKEGETIVEKPSDPGVAFGMGAIAALTAERHAELRLERLRLRQLCLSGSTLNCPN